MDTALALTRASNNAILSTGMAGLEDAFERAARANIEAAIAASGQDDYTQLEKRAMTIVEELKLVNSMDLAAILLRGRLIRLANEEALWTIHPAHYDSLEAMARDQGITLSELTACRDMCDVIFPYMEEELQMDVAQAFERIGKSNMKDMVGLLKAIITGEPSTHASLRATVEQVLSDTAATAAAAGQALDEAGLRREAVNSLLMDGERMTNRELRNRMRPERTPTISPTVLLRNGTRVVLIEMDEDQYVTLQHKLGSWALDTQEYILSEDPVIRRSVARHIPIVRQLTSLVE